MSLEKDFEAFKNAAETRKKIFDEAVNYYKSRSFQWNEYPKNSNSNAISKIESAVYAFFVKNPSGRAERILAAVGDKKMSQKDNHLPKLNTNCQELFKRKGCLYIGSVTSETLEERIKQHWREKNNDVSNKTYALKLCDWIGEAEISKDDITVYFCDMTGQREEIVRAVEDCLAAVHCPLLGKRGDSPKG